MDSKDIPGVECQNCHKETFRTFKREIVILADVCPTCARRIDDESGEEARKASLDGLSRTERIERSKEQSQEWARSWNGLQVVVRWERPDNSMRHIEHHQVRGQAFIACRTERSWGRVKVILDRSEYGRLKQRTNDRREKRGLSIDGEWGGPSLITHGYETKTDIPYAIYVNWGERFNYTIEEYDEERAAAERKAEEERIAALHRGEGI